MSWEVRKDAAGQRKGTDKILSGSLGMPMAHAPSGKEGQPVTSWEKKAGLPVRLGGILDAGWGKDPGRLES